MEQNGVALLTKKLKDVSPQERLNAAKTLGEIGDKYVIRPMIEVLGDDNSSVRAAIVEALGQIGDKSALDSLIEMMGDEDETVRNAASKALRQLGEGELADMINSTLEGKDGIILSDKRAIKALTKALSAPAPMNERAVNSLVYLGASKALVVEALWGTNESVRSIAADGLIRIGDAAVEPLLEKLIDSHGRKRAMDILIRMGEEELAGLLMGVLRGSADAVEKLVGANDTRLVAPLMEAVSPFVESKICARAIEALGKMNIPQAVEKLTSILTRYRDTYRRYSDNVETIFSVVPVALGKIGGEQTMEALLLASEDELASVRAKAALALGKYRNERVKGRLLLLLNDGAVAVCAAAADALGDVGDVSVVDSLIEALEDEKFPARENVARALGNIGDARAVPTLIKALDSFGAVHLSAVDALVKISTPAVEPLINALRQNPSPRLREDAVKALSGIGDKRAVEALGEILLTDWSLHERAAETLKELGEDEFVSLLIDVIKGDQGLTLKVEKNDDERFIRTLLKGLNAPDAQIRKRVVEALGQKKERDAVQPLIAALKDYDVGVRQSAAKALGEIGDDAAIEPLIKMLREYEITRQNAADALVAFGNASCTPLIRILGDKNPAVREMANEALKQLGEGDFATLITEALEGDEEALTQLEGADGTRAMIPLLTALSGTDVQLKKRAADALGRLGNADAVPPLLRRLIDSDITVRQSAITALGQIGDTRAFESLTKAALKDKHYSIRIASLDALTQFGDDATETLTEALTQLNAKVRQKAARELGKLKATNAIDSLITALGDSEAAVRRSAVIALGEIGDAKAIPPLMEIIVSDITSISINAVDSIGKIGGRSAVRALIQILGYEVESVRKRATEALIRIGAPAVEYLIEALKVQNLTIRHQAVMALGQIGDERAIPALRKIARIDITRILHINKEKTLRQAAREAIDKINQSDE